MRTDWHTANPHSDRDQIRRAREAAEALFRPSAPAAHQPAARNDTPATDRPSGSAAGGTAAAGASPASGPAASSPAGTAAPGAVPGSAPPAPQPPPRKPRIIAIPPTTPLRAPEPEPAPPPPKRQAKPARAAAAAVRRQPRIPSSEHGRIRTLTTYGMTADQVADLYHVSVSTIEAIISGGAESKGKNKGEAGADAEADRTE